MFTAPGSVGLIGLVARQGPTPATTTEKEILARNGFTILTRSGATVVARS
jgi:hypothetical protein